MDDGRLCDLQMSAPACPGETREPPRCQAQPKAARLGYREDMRCASLANATVAFDGADVPVCRIHRGLYLRWGADADENARANWRWGTGEERSDGSSSGARSG